MSEASRFVSYTLIASELVAYTAFCGYHQWRLTKVKDITKEEYIIQSVLNQ